MRIPEIGYKEYGLNRTGITMMQYVKIIRYSGKKSYMHSRLICSDTIFVYIIYLIAGL